MPISSATPARRHDAAGVLRVLGKAHHVAGDAPDRPHHEPVERQQDERRHDQRQHHRQGEDAEGIVDHRLPERSFVERHLNELARHVRRVVEHADDTLTAEGEGIERIADQPRQLACRRS
jgi:hypothetical protein